MNAKKLREKSNRHNRKKYRKEVLSYYKAIKKAVKKEANRGESAYKCRNLEYEWGGRDWSTINAFRLFKKRHKDFSVSEERWEVIQEKISFTIEW